MLLFAFVAVLLRFWFYFGFVVVLLCFCFYFGFVVLFFFCLLLAVGGGGGGIKLCWLIICLAALKLFLSFQGLLSLLLMLLLLTTFLHKRDYQMYMVTNRGVCGNTGSRALSKRI